ncbi:hypothetical protein [Conchiformibius steedae]|uniref:hypothetical protein n=1 Tax=Conchiformibius steedae TaxID=153493 RepID=UPI0026F22EF2|nr:hypothetical protein [Conchiformibius steedae]
MINTTLKPVTLFSSKDNGAPQLTAAAGSLKTVLKACLVSGYGDKRALGWDMPFETPNVAVFRSASGESNHHHLRVDNSSTRSVRLHPYREMTGIDAGTGYFGRDRSNNYDRFGYVERDVNRTDRWWLVGHDKAFTLIVGVMNDYYKTNGCSMFFFGDVPSLIPDDTGNTLFVSSHYDGYDYLYNGNLRALTTTYGNSARMARTWGNTETEAGVLLHSLGFAAANAAYPDVISGGTLASEIYLAEETIRERFSLRGLMPGWFKAHNDLRIVHDGSPIVIDGSDDTYLKFNAGAQDVGYYLLNVSNWES